MAYRIVFEYQTESSAMSDVLNCSDEQDARDKFQELHDNLVMAIDPSGCEVVDEPDLFGLMNREEEVYGFVRLDTV
ncbi:MAG: hypothetical protein II786_04145 [Muribaculaceae bacterium]|nr:hypothetical protein [Muribaculaceae bacterium]